MEFANMIYTNLNILSFAHIDLFCRKVAAQFIGNSFLSDQYQIVAHTLIWSAKTYMLYELNNCRKFSNQRELKQFNQYLSDPKSPIFF